MHAVRENVTYITRIGRKVNLTSLDPRKPEEAKLFDAGYRFWAGNYNVKIPYTDVGTVQLNGMISTSDIMSVENEQSQLGILSV